MGIFDILIILLFLIFMILGFIKGFLKQLFTTFGWIISLIAAFCFSTPVGNMIHNTTIGVKLNSALFEWVASQGDIFTKTISEITTDELNASLSNLGIPTFLKQMIFQKVDFSLYENMCFANVISQKIISVFLVCVSFIVIFLVLFVIAKILAKISSNIIRGSALGFFDGLLGAIWNGIKVAVFVSLVMLVLSFISSFPFGQSINAWITNDMKLLDESFGIAKIFYEHNPLVYVIDLFSFKK